jgi:ABC-type antimicrobial peptide transport system ATPase subunit
MKLKGGSEKCGVGVNFVEKCCQAEMEGDLEGLRGEGDGTEGIKQVIEKMYGIVRGVWRVALERMEDGDVRWHLNGGFEIFEGIINCGKIWEL